MEALKDPVVIVAARRTPIGGFQGALSGRSAVELGGSAIAAMMADAAGVVPDQVFMGNVLSAGLGQNPARQAALAAGLGEGVPCTTISKVCGSGMKAVIAAHDAIAAGSSSVVVAGGMESMSNAPYLLPKARKGLRLGHSDVRDHMFTDGLEDAYEGRLMGHYADELATSRQYSRQAQDDYAFVSLTRAQDALRNGAFEAEYAPSEDLSQDEQPLRARPEKIRSLRPAFSPEGTVTAANASSISDGAAALLLMPLSEAERRGLEPLARIVGHANTAHAPAQFPVAPVFAMRKLMERIGWSPDDVDLFEVNEAFAVVVLHALRELACPSRR
jgi:acetyl-CoA C-acetyltransferase